MKDMLYFKLTNVLPEDVVRKFAEYWADEDKNGKPMGREETLDEFIQRIAEYSRKIQYINKVIDVEEYYKT